ncbi:hypothetical protein ANCCEY_01428 [Ancylostoma ceylanicum]|uniref:AMP-binding enzyme n=1 Tax=Ancylostoma ceylanicum TaxID=53326 RepID=A0A0D6MAA7_9BILA|nr:hypothetical protein ANCCEY_01428 [Ancylostoma ceylanicum]
MEIQNAFQIQWDKTPYPSFTDYFFTKISTHGSNLAIVTSSSRVAVITGTTGQAIFVHLACSIIGCTAVAVNGLSPVDEIWQLVDLSESSHLIVEQQFMQKADDVRRKAAMRGGGRIKHVRLIDDVLTTDTISSEPKKRHPLVKEPSTAKMMWVYSCGKVLENVPCAGRVPRIPSPEDTHVDVFSPISDVSGSKENGTEERCESPPDVPAPTNSNAGNTNNPMLIFFTSGTTGLPKQMSLPLYGPVQQRERFLLPLSISHIYGAVSAYYALVNGATVYMMSRVSPKTLIENLAHLNINVSHITPTMVMWLAMDPALENTQVNSLRSVLVAGAPIDSNLANNAKRKLNLKDMRQTYGMTELGGLCTLSHYECDKIETVGTPLPGMLFKVVNWETKQLCPPRTPGQLMVLGPQVMPSYYKNPKATTELLDPNGYVKTGFHGFTLGDAAFYDETGHIYVLDRIKDIVRYKGTLVCPSEVELMLRAHPGIDDCAVVGRQDHVSGEQVPAAFVVKSPTHPLLSSAEVRQYVSGKIATFKELRGGVFFVPEIPRSSCGKVLRRQLRQFWDRERTNSKDIITKDGKGQKANEKPDRTPVKRANGSATPTKRLANRHVKK